jgi:hypothetical protein
MEPRREERTEAATEGHVGNSVMLGTVVARQQGRAAAEAVATATAAGESMR